MGTSPTRTRYGKLGDREPFEGGYPTAEFWIGDGARPAGLPTAEFKSVLVAAQTNWMLLDSPCTTRRPAKFHQRWPGNTTYETDMEIVDGKTMCGERDGVSTIDAGDLADNGRPPVALHCGWFKAGKDVVWDENDIRFNVVDYGFTTTPLAAFCHRYQDYDLESVATHELGHAWGLADLSVQNGASAADDGLTMWGSSFPCRRLARTLGKGDVLGWLAIYE